MHRQWAVLIVEDDPIIASAYWRVVDGMSMFWVNGIAAGGEAALQTLEHRRADLAVRLASPA